jgi:transcriptional antiterminator Rof (Rho-off)
MLELLAMRRMAVEVVAVDESGQPQRLEGNVVDVLTRDGAEYLVLRHTGAEPVSLRLDRLRTISDLAGETLWRQ